MPLNPSSYKKIFKSKYIQDDSDEEPVDDDEYKPVSTNTTSYPSYNPTSSVSTSTYISKKPLLTSTYLNSHPELDDDYPKYKSSSKPLLSSPYLDSLESRNSLAPERSPLRSLPPIPNRMTPSRRTYDETAPFITETTPSRFQTRPLRNLTVVSRSITPVRSTDRSPSPMDSYSWRSNKSITPAPRRIYPQTSASVNLDDLLDKEEAPVIFDANLTFVLGCKGKIKQNLSVRPAHVEKDTASSCLSEKINDFLKRTDHVMEEWKSMGHRNDANGNLRNSREKALMGKSKSATNIMIKGFQLFSKASSCSRSSIGRDQMSDCTEAESDEVLAN